VSLGPTSRTGGTEAWSSPRIGGGDGASPNSGEVEGSPAAGHGQDVTRGEMSSSLCSIQRWVVRRGGRGDNGARSLLKQGMAGKAWGAGPVRSCHAEEQGTGAGMTHTRARGG
jgi:hypothetical protein